MSKIVCAKTSRQILSKRGTETALNFLRAARPPLTTARRNLDDSTAAKYTTMSFASLTSTMNMSFLRPMALPRAATLSRFLSTATSSAATPAATTSAAIDAAQLTYRVNRTPSQQLPIYLLAKRGGNLKQTRLRKIEGDIGKLKQDLQKALGIAEDKEIQINQLTKHIIIKVGSDLPRGS